MSPELDAAAAFAVALLVTLLATPIAIAVAKRTGFLDRPVGYKGHAGPTPYLGGAALMAGVLVAGLLIGDGAGTHAVVLGGAFVLWLLGTADDKLNLSPLLRVVAEVAVAMTIVASGAVWSLTGTAAVDDALTILWLLGVVNAFNLMDNMNGAAATTAAVSSAGAGLLALLSGAPQTAALAFALSGACAGFLRFNLARPSRIFMGDGGSMPLGLLVAYLVMQAATANSGSFGALVVGVVLVGLAVLDTSLVVVSRRRGQRPLLSGGRDHLTHRLRTRLVTPERVALALGLTQALLVVAAVSAAQRGDGAIVLLGTTLTACGLVAIWVLEQPQWATSEASGSPASGEVSGHLDLAPELNG